MVATPVPTPRTSPPGSTVATAFSELHQTIGRVRTWPSGLRMEAVRSLASPTTIEALPGLMERIADEFTRCSSRQAMKAVGSSRGKYLPQRHTVEPLGNSSTERVTNVLGVGTNLTRSLLPIKWATTAILRATVPRRQWHGRRLSV